MKNYYSPRSILILSFLVIVQLFIIAFPAASKDVDLQGAAIQSAPPLSSFLNIRVDTIENQLPKVVYNSRHNEFLVVWEERVIPRSEIFGQRVGLDGSLKGNAIRLAYDSSFAISLPAVAYSSKQDKYLIAYTITLSATDYDIRSVLMNWDGSSITDISIDPSSNTRHWYPAVAYNYQNDEFIVVYEYYKTGTDGREIIAQRRQAGSGIKIGGNTVVAGVTGEVRRFPQLAYSSSRNEYFFAYVHAANTNPTSFTKIRGKRFNADLSTVLTNETDLTTNDYADGVSLAAGPDEFLAVWSEKASGGPEKIWGRRVNGSGTLGPFVKFADHTPQSCVEPAVAFSPIYGYFISWRFVSGGSTGDDIYGRFIRAGQDAPTDVEFVIDNTNFSQRSPAQACASSGACLLVEEDNWSPLSASDYQIRGKLVLTYPIYLPLILRN